MRKILFALYLSLLLLDVAAQAEATNSTNRVHFYFVQITDTHLGSADHLDRTRRIVAAINNLPMKIECVVHTGDIMADEIDNDALVKEALSVLHGLRVPLHTIPGNHDILSKAPVETLAAYRKSFGDITGSADYQGVRFLFFYSEPLRRRVPAPGYSPMAWIKAALKEAGNRPVIIFDHAPSVEDFYNNTFHKGWRPDLQASWETLVNSHNVKAIITGHFHRDELHWIGNVPLFVCPPVAGYWGRTPTFRIYEYIDGKVGYRTVYDE